MLKLDGKRFSILKGSSSYMEESVPMSRNVVLGSGTLIWSRFAVAVSREDRSGGFSTLDASGGYGNSLFKDTPSKALDGFMSGCSANHFAVWDPSPGPRVEKSRQSRSISLLLLCCVHNQPPPPVQPSSSSSPLLLLL